MEVVLDPTLHLQGASPKSTLGLLEKPLEVSSPLLLAGLLASSLPTSQPLLPLLIFPSPQHSASTCYPMPYPPQGILDEVGLANGHEVCDPPSIHECPTAHAIQPRSALLKAQFAAQGGEPATCWFVGAASSPPLATPTELVPEILDPTPALTWLDACNESLLHPREFLLLHHPQTSPEKLSAAVLLHLAFESTSASWWLHSWNPQSKLLHLLFHHHYHFVLVGHLLKPLLASMQQPPMESPETCPHLLSFHHFFDAFPLPFSFSFLSPLFPPPLLPLPEVEVKVAPSLPPAAAGNGGIDDFTGHSALRWPVAEHSQHRFFWSSSGPWRKPQARPSVPQNLQGLVPGGETFGGVCCNALTFAPELPVASTALDRCKVSASAKMTWLYCQIAVASGRASTPNSALLCANLKAVWESSCPRYFVACSKLLISNVPSGRLVPISWARWKLLLQWRIKVAKSPAEVTEGIVVKVDRSWPFSPDPPGWYVISSLQMMWVDVKSRFAKTTLRISSVNDRNNNPMPLCSVRMNCGVQSSEGKVGLILTRCTGVLWRHSS